MTKYRVLLVGAGSLGRHYLEGLAKVNRSIEIIVSINNSTAIKQAAARTADMAIEPHVTINFTTNVLNISGSFDLGINATTSGVRASSLKYVGKLARSWILEKILTQNVTQMTQIESALHHCEVWVNARCENCHGFKR